MKDERRAKPKTRELRSNLCGRWVNVKQIKVKGNYSCVSQKGNVYTVESYGEQVTIKDIFEGDFLA